MLGDRLKMFEKGRETLRRHAEGGNHMKVKDVMTSPVLFCAPETNLEAAAMIMWESDCGALPVVNHEQQVVGMITDRDICMARGDQAPACLRDCGWGGGLQGSVCLLSS